MKRKKQIFLRAGYTMISKLGKRRKKKRKYRKATGIDNKVRLKKRGHLRNVSIGFRNEKEIRGLIEGLKPVLISNVEELKNIKKNEIAVVGSVGKKKKKEIAEYSLKNNIRLLNLNPKKFLEELEKSRVPLEIKKENVKEKKSEIKDDSKELNEKESKENEPEK